MSRTKKHPPKPDRFTRRDRTAANQARAKRVVATIRHLHLEGMLPVWMWDRFQRSAAE
jgi:hypothetical protein